MVMSSEVVAPARKGRMVRGASVWPMKMLAATLVDSAPLVPMVRNMIQATSADDALHDAEVVEHGKEGADEDDGGEDGEGEDGEGIAGSAERAEDEGRAVDGVGEQRGDDGRGGVEDALAERPLDHEEGEEDLQAEAPGDGAPADGAAVGGGEPSDGEEDGEAEQAGESGQGGSVDARDVESVPGGEHYS